MYKKIIAVTLAAVISTVSAGICASASEIDSRDLNGDGKFDVQDVTYLQVELADVGSFINSGNNESTADEAGKNSSDDELSQDTDQSISAGLRFDINGDGVININDVTYLQKQISEASLSELENNTKISVSSSELYKNVCDTFTIDVETNNSLSQMSFTTSDSSVAKIVSVDKHSVRLKANKVGTSTVTIKQCKETCTVKVKVDRAKCIDLSLWNGDIDFGRVKRSGINCVILRAGYGKDPNQEDEKFQEYYRDAKAAGLNVGAYWYSYATSANQAKQEVENCMKTIRGKEFELPVFYDVEEYRMAILPRRTLTDVISAFCDGIRSNGFEAGMYSAESMLMDSAYPDEISSKYLVWMSSPSKSYSELPSFVDIHQYSFSGSVDGIPEKVDMNYIYNLNT